MDLEFHRLDLRYESLRIRHPTRERRLLASLSDVGQLLPIAVVPGGGDDTDHVVIDGFARVRALKQLREDTVRAVVWEMTELEALLLSRSMRSAEGDTSLEQSWLLAELQQTFGLDQQELARRFDRSTSWVSRRLALIKELPECIHLEIRQGLIAPHAAAKYLVPLARANRVHCERLARAIAKNGFSTRDVGRIYASWRDGSAASRERLMADPALFLRVHQSATEPSENLPLNPRDGVLKEIGFITNATRRLKKHLCSKGPRLELTAVDHEDLLSGLRFASGEIRSSVESLLKLQLEGEQRAGSEYTDGDPRAA